MPLDALTYVEIYPDDADSEWNATLMETCDLRRARTTLLITDSHQQVKVQWELATITFFIKEFSTELLPRQPHRTQDFAWFVILVF